MPSQSFSAGGSGSGGGGSTPPPPTAAAATRREIVAGADPPATFTIPASWSFSIIVVDTDPASSDLATLNGDPLPEGITHNALPLPANRFHPEQALEVPAGIELLIEWVPAP